MQKPLAALVIALILGSLSAAQGAQYNKRPHVGPGSRAKIDRVIAKGRSIDAAARIGKIVDKTEKQANSKRKCGQEIGGVIVDKDAGGQKVVVVTRDIINTGGRVLIASDCE